METGEIGIIIALIVGYGTLMWNLRTYGSKIDRLEQVVLEVRSDVKALDRRIESVEGQIESESDRLDRKVESEANRLDRRIESIEDKVSDAALAAARNEGRYEALTAQTHTHESPPAAAD